MSGPREKITVVGLPEQFSVLGGTYVAESPSVYKHVAYKATMLRNRGHWRLTVPSSGTVARTPIQDDSPIPPSSGAWEVWSLVEERWHPSNTIVVS